MSTAVTPDPGNTRRRTTGYPVSVSRLVHIYHTEGHDVAALSGVDLDIDAGSTLALLGPSGAGKSTLLTLIAGMARPTAGTITIGDTRVDQLDDAGLDAVRGHQLSLVLQGGRRNLLPHLSVTENMRLAQWGASTTDLPDIADVLELVDLDPETAARTAAYLSPSQAQRAALAVAIAPGPGLLLADEPTASLSGPAAATVIQAMRRINTEWGTTILMVTHDAEAAAAMDRTVTIRDGRVGAQAHDGVEVAMIAPDGSLPLPDDILEDFPAGTFVQISRDDAPNPRVLVEPWTRAPQDRTS